MDAGLIWKEMGADLAIEDLALVRDDGLKTAVILSLFCDRRAEEDDVLPNNTGDRRGWWADTYSEIEDDKLGSRLWLLSREKQLPSVLARAKEYAKEALEWMVEDGVAEDVIIETWWIRTGAMGLLAKIVRPDAPALEYKFEYLWEGM